MVVCSCRMERRWVSRLRALLGMLISRQRIQQCKMGKNTIAQAFKTGHLKSLSNVIHKFTIHRFSHRLCEVLIPDTQATNLTTTKGLLEYISSSSTTTLKDKTPSPNSSNEEDWTTPWLAEVATTPLRCILLRRRHITRIRRLRRKHLNWWNQITTNMDKEMLKQIAMVNKDSQHRHQDVDRDLTNVDLISSSNSSTTMNLLDVHLRVRAKSKIPTSPPDQDIATATLLWGLRMIVNSHQPDSVKDKTEGTTKAWTPYNISSTANLSTTRIKWDIQWS